MYTKHSQGTSQHTVQQFFLKTLCHMSLFISVMFEFTERWCHKAWPRQLCIFNGAAAAVIMHVSDVIHHQPSELIHINTLLPYIHRHRVNFEIILLLYTPLWQSTGWVVAVSCCFDLCQLSLQYQVHPRRDSVMGHGRPEWQKYCHNITISVFSLLQQVVSSDDAYALCNVVHSTFLWAEMKHDMTANKVLNTFSIFI